MLRRTFGGLGETEWVVMRCCWNLGKATARQVYDASQKYGKRSYQTIKTILDRLEFKGFLEREKLGPIYLYTPIANEEKTTNNAIDTFFEVVLGNTFAPIFVRLFREKKFEHDLEEIKKMIDKLGEND